MAFRFVHANRYYMIRTRCAGHPQIKSPPWRADRDLEIYRYGCMMAHIRGIPMTKFEDDEVLRHLTNVKPRKEDKGAFWMGVAFVALALCIPAYQALL